ncbi:hypothetical protein BC829DRAFT_413134 [Chytridium lagenaria]|nr:hypothetical protein BC829DRAFT_413134 [Chytridium lagenaria]
MGTFDASKEGRKTKAHDVAEQLSTRMANELPRMLQLDLINDAIPVIAAYLEGYKRQLGEKHSFTTGAQKHLERLKKMETERSFTLADMPTEEEERAAANAMAIQ